MRDSENANVIYRRIGNTTYKLRVHFSGEATETMEEKILRLIRSEALDKREKRGIINTATSDPAA